MRITQYLFIASALLAQTVWAHGPKPGPLINVPIPEVPGLLDGNDPIVINKEKAIALGKALFWDTNVGSDGMACGSCHFHAGADVRTKNQMNPGTKNVDLPGGDKFDVLGSGEGGPNHTLKMADFPLHKRENPFDKNSAVIADTEDSVASSGTFSGKYQNTSRLTGGNDNCERGVDPIFNVGDIHTRRVEPRNAPTIFNAVFFYRLFWDGRANNVFNGSSLWGDRDPDAGVWVKSGRNVTKQRLHLENSALASVGTNVPLSDLEMSCQQRSIIEVGRKLLSRQPLQTQKVHYQDSVFGPQGLTYSSASQELPGLKTTYKALITQAFNPKYWSFSGSSKAFPSSPEGQTPYNQMEVNFPLFMGLALQLYQSTLISDQAPIDLVPRKLDNVNAGTYLDPDWHALYPGEAGTENFKKAEQIKKGFDAFMNNHCATCHGGPLATTAATASYVKMVTPTEGAFYGPSSAPIYYGPQALGPNDGAAVAGINRYGSVVTRDVTGGEHPGRFMDIGFANTGVGNPDADPGLGGFDDFGNPLSFSYQYQQYLAGYTDKVLDSVVYKTRACDFIMALVDPYYDIFTDFETDLFNGFDALEDDGARDGVDKSQNCHIGDTMGVMNVPKIPTIAAARSALEAGLPKMQVGTKAAFKIPSLRNVELTGPYMHNGSMATLEQVVEFYSRQGNFLNDNQHGFLTSITLAGTATPPGSSITSQEVRAGLVAFLKTFTDERVRYERAPFDHPEIKVPHGHVGDAQSVTAGNTVDPNLAKDEFLIVPASGANGLAEPLQPFETFLEP